MDARAFYRKRRNVGILPAACIVWALWSVSCGGGGASTPVPVSTAGFSLSPATISFGNQAVGSTGSSLTATLVNSGNATLTISSIQMTGPNSGDFTEKDNCVPSLAPSAQCTATLTFVPSASGPRTASLVFTDNAAGSPQTLGITGTGTSATVGLSSTTLAFGSQLQGTTTPAQSVTLTNNGSAALNFSSIAVSGTNPGDFAASNNCGGSLAAGGNCTINVTFTPGATGSRAATLTIADDAVGSPQAVSLTGTGSGPSVNLSASNLTFNQNLGTTSAGQTVTLTNNGNAALSIFSIGLAGSNPANFSENSNCGTSVATGGTCTITVTFTPSSAASYSAGVSISDNAPGSPQMITLAGTGVGTGAVGTLSAASLEFGNQTTGTTSGGQTVTLTNTGNASLTFSAIAAPAPFAIFAPGTTCSTSVPVAPAGFCAVTIVFSPTGAGAASGSLLLTDNATNNPQAVSLSGMGTTSMLSISATSLVFPLQAVGTSSTPPQTVVVTNEGATSLTIGNITVGGTNAGDFSQSNTCTGSLAANGHCTINVTFAPTLPGSRLAAVTLVDTASDSPQTINQAGIGGGPRVNLTATSLIFGGQTLGTTSPVQAVTLVNTGNAALNITGLGLTGANPSDFFQTNTCGSSVPAGGNCNISVAFIPTAPGSRSAALTITDNASGSPQTVSLTGSGNGPVVSFSTSALSFSSQSVGSTSAAQAVTLTNTGNASLTISSIQVTGGNSGDFAATSTCGSSVAAGALCTINVTFAPTGPGTRTAAVTIVDNATNSPQTVSLTGTGSAPLAAVTPTSLAFNSQNLGTTSAAQTVTLNNTGNTALTIGGVAFSGADPGDFAQTNNCGSSLAANGSCAINVTFSPTGAGSRAASLILSDNSNNTAGSKQSVGLTGSGNGPNATLSPPSLSFGSQTEGVASNALSITLTNTGSVNLTSLAITVAGANATDFAQTNNCGSVLGVNASCTIKVTFTPSASGGRTAAISFTDNAPGSPQTVAVSGTGLSGHVSLTPSSLSFGNQNVGTAGTAQSVSMTNTGNAAFNIFGISLIGANPGDFSQTNGCGTSLAVNSSCTFVVKFSPTAFGVRTATVSISDSLQSSPEAIGLSGTGTAPSVSLSPGSLTFSTQSLGTHAAQSVTLTNLGNSTLTITSLGATGANASDFAVANTCGSSVAANGSCVVSVTFTPSAIGTRTAAVSIADNAPGSPQTVSLNGSGSAPVAGVTPASLSFSSQNLGTTSSAQSVTLNNTGNAALAISSVTFTGANPGDFAETSTCGGTLASGGSCTFSVTFSPTGAGSRTASLTITDNNNGVAGSQQLVSLSGSGTGASVSLNPSSTLTFGSQTKGVASAAQSIILTNTGNASLALTGIALGGANPGDFAQTNTCGSSVAANATCTINVTFTPTALSSRTASINITDNAPGSPQSVNLTGTGSASVASLSAVTLTFAGQTVLTTSSPQTFTLTNTGNVSLAITSILVTGSNAADFVETNNCPGSLAANGGSCTINVTFTPSAAGSRTAAVTISDNATTGSPQAVSLVGTGITGVVGLSATTLNFGSQSLGTTSATQVVTLTNGGSSILTISSVQLTGTNPGDFGMPSNTCGASLAVNASCQVSVAFTPTAAGTRAATLTFTDNATNSPQTVSLTGSGTAPVGALSPSTYNFGNVAGGTSSSPAPFTLSNTGTANLSIAGIGLTGANPSDFGNNTTCGTTLAASSNCPITVTCTPTVAGIRSANLVVTDNSNNVPGSTQSAPLACTGLHDVIVSWTASPTSGVVGYYIFRGLASNAEASTPVNSLPLNATSYVDTNVTAGIKYFYYITAVASDGFTQSAPSNEASATVPTP